MCQVPGQVRMESSAHVTREDSEAQWGEMSHWGCEVVGDGAEAGTRSAAFFPCHSCNFLEILWFRFTVLKNEGASMASTCACWPVNSFQPLVSEISFFQFLAPRKVMIPKMSCRENRPGLGPQSTHCPSWKDSTSGEAFNSSSSVHRIFWKLSSLNLACLPFWVEILALYI